MIEVTNIEVWGFEHAVRGMRNPMNSWNKSDSGYGIGEDEDVFEIGKNDLDLMRRLYKAGSEHRKYLRQVMCSFDCYAPLYWWKEFETYKISVVSNSCSTMHKIHAKPFELTDFSHEHLTTDEPIPCTVLSGTQFLEGMLNALNHSREMYLETKDKKWWWQMIQLLPSSYNQKRTITMNYENVVTIIKQRTGHKLDEWNEFVKVMKSLPYIEEIMEIDNE